MCCGMSRQRQPCLVLLLADPLGCGGWHTGDVAMEGATSCCLPPSSPRREFRRVPLSLWSSSFHQVKSNGSDMLKKASVGLGIMETILSETMRTPLLLSKCVNSPPKGGGPQAASSHQSTTEIPASQRFRFTWSSSTPVFLIALQTPTLWKGHILSWQGTERKWASCNTMRNEVSGLIPHPSW